MREYVIPPSDQEEEKIFGAILNMRQMLWLLGGAGFGIVLSVVITIVTGDKQLGMFLGLPFCLSGTPFAFYKRKGIPIDKYLLLRYKHKKKTQVLKLKGH